MTTRTPGREGGATLFVGLIMLVLITLMVVAALNLSNSNLRAVGNMQFRDEAIAAANVAVNQVLESAFATNASYTGETIAVDIDGNGTTDYDVTIQTPVCIRAAQASEQARSSLSLPATMSSASTWHTFWEITAVAVPHSGNSSGATVTVKAGVRVLLSESDRNTRCL